MALLYPFPQKNTPLREKVSTPLHRNKIKLTYLWLSIAQPVYLLDDLSNCFDSYHTYLLVVN